MCIVCNLPPQSVTPAVFLAARNDTNKAMRKMEAAMLEASREALTPELRARYNRHHKRLVKLRRLFNCADQLREWQ